MSAASENLKNLISTSVSTTINRSDVEADPAAAAPIINAVSNAIVPLVLHSTNNEQWFQSKVTLGAVATLLGGGYSLIMDFYDGIPPSVDSFSAQAIGIAGAALVLYGRWAARGAIGK